MMNLRGVLLSLGLLSVFGTGCVVEVGVSRNRYESCTPGDSCNFSTCTTANVSTGGSLCTVSCTNTSACTDANTACIGAPGTTLGQCFRTCIGGTSCPSGTVCAVSTTIQGTAVQTCIPNTSAVPTCGGAGLACCAGNTCTGGLACVNGTCATPVPVCGGSGQPCCAGNVCTGGLACVNNTCAPATPARQFYAKCVAGDTCSAGTTCIQASVQVAGMAQGSHCSTLCPSGAANTCPGYVAGQVECIAINGNLAQAQCFRLCQSTNDCAPFNTTCTQIMMPAGPIRVCAPTG